MYKEIMYKENEKRVRETRLPCECKVPLMSLMGGRSALRDAGREEPGGWGELTEPPSEAVAGSPRGRGHV